MVEGTRVWAADDGGKAAASVGGGSWGGEGEGADPEAILACGGLNSHSKLGCSKQRVGKKVVGIESLIKIQLYVETQSSLTCDWTSDWKSSPLEEHETWPWHTAHHTTTWKATSSKEYHLHNREPRGFEKGIGMLTLREGSSGKQTLKSVDWAYSWWRVYF